MESTWHQVLCCSCLGRLARELMWSLWECGSSGLCRSVSCIMGKEYPLDPKGRRKRTFSVCAAPNFSCPIASRGGISVSAESLAHQKDQQVVWVLFWSRLLFACYSRIIICFAGTALQFLYKTGEKLWNWVRKEMDDFAAARKEERVSDIFILPNEICIWV